MAALTLAEARRRDAVLRAYVEGLDWDLAGETELRRHLVVHSEVLPRFNELSDAAAREGRARGEPSRRSGGDGGR